MGMTLITLTNGPMGMALMTITNGPMGMTLMIVSNGPILISHTRSGKPNDTGQSWPAIMGHGSSQDCRSVLAKWQSHHEGWWKDVNHMHTSTAVYCFVLFFILFHQYLLMGKRKKMEWLIKIWWDKAPQLKMSSEGSWSHDLLSPSSLRMTPGQLCAQSAIQFHDPTWPHSRIFLRMIHSCAYNQETHTRLRPEWSPIKTKTFHPQELAEVTQWARWMEGKRNQIH